MVLLHQTIGGRRDRMVVGNKTTCAISAYHHWSCEFEPRSWYNWNIIESGVKHHKANILHKSIYFLNTHDS